MSRDERVSAAHDAVLREVGACDTDYDNGLWCRQHDSIWRRDRGEAVCDQLDTILGVADEAVEAAELALRAEIEAMGSKSLQHVEYARTHVGAQADPLLLGEAIAFHRVLTLLGKGE